MTIGWQNILCNFTTQINWQMMKKSLSNIAKTTFFWFIINEMEVSFKREIYEVSFNVKSTAEATALLKHLKLNFKALWAFEPESFYVVWGETFHFHFSFPLH